MSHQPSKSNKWELIKKAQERFDNRFPPIAIGYDGSVDDDKKRQAHRDFMSTEVQIAIEAKDAETKKAVEKARGWRGSVSYNLLTGMRSGRTA